MRNLLIKKDKFKSARGGYTRMLEISCQDCSAHVCQYQKDGPGNLRRMYKDRIINPSTSISNKNLLCPNKHTLGVSVIYSKEGRPAFRLFVDAVVKKIIKAQKSNQ